MKLRWNGGRKGEDEGEGEWMGELKVEQARGQTG